jgi:hypothetical protein
MILLGLDELCGLQVNQEGPMSIELSDISLPDQAEVKIEVSITSKVNITAIVAQRKVSKLVLDQVSNLFYGAHPALVASERLLWRVPIWFGLPSTGPLGQVGAIDVDTQSGEILYTQFDLDEMAARAHELAQRTASASA